MHVPYNIRKWAINKLLIDIDMAVRGTAQLYNIIILKVEEETSIRGSVVLPQCISPGGSQRVRSDNAFTVLSCWKM
jgi:hypothetical protein